jgi:arsenate reductase
MAEGLMRKIGSDRYDVFSAGTKATCLHPLAVETMKTIGIDISRHLAKNVAAFKGQAFDYVITLCDRAGKTCLASPDAASIHWAFEDPTRATGAREDQLRVFQRVRDELMNRIRLFVLANHE